jgi:hypothetical protein
MIVPPLSALLPASPFNAISNGAPFFGTWLQRKRKKGRIRFGVVKVDVV